MAEVDIDELSHDERHKLEEVYRRKEEVLEKISKLERVLNHKQEYIDAFCLEEIDLRVSLSDPKQTARAFNKKPKKTVEKLIEHNVIQSSPISIAKYLWENRNLSKKSIGEYFCDDSTKDILREYIELQDLNTTNIVSSLRAFLNSIVLSGESQVIDRILDTFATWYCSKKNDPIFNSDNCHTFLYALLMLNTSLHNPRVVHSTDVMKPTDFLKICEGTKLNREFLLECFTEIKNNPFVHDKFADITRDFMAHSIKTGYLEKQSSKYWLWNKRWFVLINNCLYYFEDSKSSSPRGIISLESIRMLRVEDRTRLYCIELFSVSSGSVTVCKLETGGTISKASHNSVRLAAESENELNEWILAIERSLLISSKHYDLMELKRSRSLNR